MRVTPDSRPHRTPAYIHPDIPAPEPAGTRPIGVVPAVGETVMAAAAASPQIASARTEVVGTGTPTNQPSHPTNRRGQSPTVPAIEESGGAEGRQRLHRPSLVFLLCATVLLGIAIPLCAHAETERTLALVGTTSQLFDNIRNWLMGILAGLATVILSVGGVRYLIAGGDTGEVEGAKRAFKAAAIGYCLAALAPLVLSILQQIIGAS